MEHFKNGISWIVDLDSWVYNEMPENQFIGIVGFTIISCFWIVRIVKLIIDGPEK
jgi:ribosomal protein L21E